ncbi:GNAT family N-acetyltransferase [Arsenicicoccus piscis]|uniref:N-acetyltransferase GCN5 n=1 Tax=Arsenicicoccus piscis TaxID=673954 RepID=A0ABQ6HQ11_9MICO|nr:GNAT family N-acetyltransferase [Arsenicicoccus piscis]MCH8628789.1 GNAT family N-acetyltransferase [Arsenicicoccus piscis]GMA20163.1 N-acetyltransferase GCN5 [Arsenicicoccus piscis]
MLRSRSALVRALTPADEDAALALCARDPDQHVFVASRIVEGALVTQPGALLGYVDETSDLGLRSLLWSSANVVPVECDGEAIEAFAHKIRRRSRWASSLFGPTAEVNALWHWLRSPWGPARAIRTLQPVMASSTLPSELGLRLDPEVRRARRDELDAVVVAAAAMFTEEIGYPPYSGSPAAYRNGVAGLLAKGHTFVRTLGDEVIFKADVGSVALGVAQVQGVWVTPRLRGQGLAAPAMASVLEEVLTSIAPRASLYVNEFNTSARATYRRIGMDEVAAFTTVLL